MVVLFLAGLLVVVVVMILLIRGWGRREERLFAEQFEAAGRQRLQQVDERMQAEEALREQEQAEQQAFRARAKRYSATVASAKQIGEYNFKPLLKLQLAIEAPDGTYAVDIEYAPDAQEAHRYARGSRIDVYVDPNDRQRVECVD